MGPTETLEMGPIQSRVIECIARLKNMYFDRIRRSKYY